MTREEIWKDPWFGDQRAAVLALLDRAELAERERDTARRDAAELLEMVEHETGERVRECWCTSSGNEDPPGSVDMPCAPCRMRKTYYTEKKQ